MLLIAQSFHGNFEQLKANAKIAKSCKVKKILIPKNGDIFQFVDDNPTCVDRIEMDTKVFDGEKVVSLKDEKFTIRKQALKSLFSYSKFFIF